MPISFNCEHCHKEVKAPDEAAGKRGKCPFCGGSNYIPAPVSDDDLLPLAPIDDAEEQARKREAEALREHERQLLAEMGGAAPEPLEHRETVSEADLHHLVVNYCLDLAGGKLPRSATHAAALRKFGPLGIQAVRDFQSGKVLEPVLDSIPTKVLQGFLRQLMDDMK